jgi:hypothetical protein
VFVVVNVALSMKMCVANVCGCEIWMHVFVVVDVCDYENVRGFGIWIFVAMEMYVVRINKIQGGF